MWNWNKIKSFFGSSAPTEDGANDSERHGDYTVRKNTKFDIFARILAILAALLLWTYVVSTTTVSEEREFSLIPVVCNGEENLRSEHGLLVQSMSIDTLNVSLMGNRQNVRAVTDDQVKAYVSLSDIQEAGEYKLTVYVDVPSGITLVSQTVSQVVVKVDSVATKELPVTEKDLSLRGWSLTEGCFFGRMQLNIDHITLEGPTLSLEKVAGVELRSDVVGAATENFTVTATPYLLDADGNVLSDSAVNIREKGKIEVNVEVLKSKTVQLVVQGKYGYLTADQVSLSPSTAVITGSPQAVDATKSLLVAVVDETKLATEEERTFTLNVSGLTVVDDKNASLVSVKAVFDLSDLPTGKIENVAVLRGGEVVGSVSVTVRSVNAESAVILQNLTAEDLEVFSDNERPEGDLTAMTVVFGESFGDHLYVVQLSDYSNQPPVKASNTDAELSDLGAGAA